MSYVLHQEWFSDHKTTFLGSLSYQKVDFDVFVLQIPSNLAWARSSHQLKWPGFPNISNLVRLENQAQILKNLQIFFLGSAYIYSAGSAKLLSGAGENMNSVVPFMRSNQKLGIRLHQKYGGKIYPEQKKQVRGEC